MDDVMKCKPDVIKALEDYQGITDVETFGEFENEEWNGVVKQFLSPPMKSGGTPQAPTLTRQSPIIITAISLKRLKAASCAVRYCKSCGYALTVQNMEWVCIEMAFEVMKSLDDAKDQVVKLPRLSRDGLFPLWVEKYSILLDRIVGYRGIPLSAIIRKDVIPAIGSNGHAPALLLHKPYAEEYGSVEMTLIERATHDHALYNQDDRKLFEVLSAAWSNTGLDTCIAAQTQRSKSGRVLYLQAIKEFAGANKWLEIVDHNEKQLTTTKYNGNGTKYTLLMHIARHRSAYAKLLSASKQGSTSFALPDEPTRVRYFLQSIDECSDQKMISRIESVKSDEKTIDNKNQDFDLCVQYLLPACPVYARQRAGGTSSTDDANDTKKKNASVSDVNIQRGKGKTGVDLRWHSFKEYKSLNKQQKDELSAWQRSPEGKKATDAYKATRKRSNPGNPEGSQLSKKNFKKAVLAVVESDRKKEMTSNQKRLEMASQLASVLSLPGPTPANSVGSVAVRKSDAEVNARVATVLMNHNVRFDEID